MSKILTKNAPITNPKIGKKGVSATSSPGDKSERKLVAIITPEENPNIKSKNLREGSLLTKRKKAPIEPTVQVKKEANNAAFTGFNEKRYNSVPFCFFSMSKLKAFKETHPAVFGNYVENFQKLQLYSNKPNLTF